jgi:hypothetical protein
MMNCESLASHLRELRENLRELADSYSTKNDAKQKCRCCGVQEKVLFGQLKLVSRLVNAIKWAS